MQSLSNSSKTSSVPEVFVEIKPTLWYGEHFYAALDAERELIRILSEEIEKEITQQWRETYEASLENGDK